jgi:hypothetical protein
VGAAKGATNSAPHVRFAGPGGWPGRQMGRKLGCPTRRYYVWGFRLEFVAWGFFVPLPPFVPVSELGRWRRRKVIGRIWVPHPLDLGLQWVRATCARRSLEDGFRRNFIGRLAWTETRNTRLSAQSFGLTVSNAGLFVFLLRLPKTTRRSSGPRRVGHPPPDDTSGGNIQEIFSPRQRCR